MDINIKNQSDIITDLLSNISDKYEKSVGFLTYDINKSTSIELSLIYNSILSLYNKIDVNNLEGDELTKYVFQRKGIIRKEATFAKVELTLTGTGTINEGDLFSTSNNILFESTETKSITNSGTIIAKCTESGTIGMVGADTITQFPITLQGFTDVTNIQGSYDGFEEETDESLRERYYEALQLPITSNNIAHYRKWCRDVAGVSDARIEPLWNGVNTVKAIIINDNKLPASQALIDEVQDYIDPKGTFDGSVWSTWGQGYGVSNMGNYLTVESAIQKDITISVTVIKDSQYTLTEIETAIQNNVNEYLKTIAFDEVIDYLSYARVGQIILDTEGVGDYSNLTLNGLAQNVTFANNEVGFVTVVNASE